MYRKTPDVAIANKEPDVKIGQGEGDTRWNGWALKLLLIKFVMDVFFLHASQEQIRKPIIIRYW